ncbi:MAG: hypothetical protein KC416_03000 [Myxococcales bacterium]|nr:hypothetical protein [Myxococcales bacterium]
MFPYRDARHRSRKAWILGRALLLFCSLVSVWGSQAHAQVAATAAEEREANERTKEGAALMEADKACEAVKKFEESMELFPDPRKLINIGLANEKCGNLVESRTAFQTFVGEHGGNYPSDFVEKVQSKLDQLAPRIPQIKLLIQGIEGETVQIRLDGQDLPAETSIGEYIAVNPGKHTVEVHRNTGLAKREQFEVADWERRQVEFVVPPPCQDLDQDNKCDEMCTDRDLNGTCDKDECSGTWNEKRKICVVDRDEESSIVDEPVFWIVTGAVVVAGLAVGAYFIIDSQIETPEPATSTWPNGPFKVSNALTTF